MGYHKVLELDYFCAIIKKIHKFSFSSNKLQKGNVMGKKRTVVENIDFYKDPFWDWYIQQKQAYQISESDMTEHIRRTLDSSAVADEVLRVVLGQRLGLDPMKTPDQYMMLIDLHQNQNMREYGDADSWAKANKTAMQITAATIKVEKENIAREKARIAPDLDKLEKARKDKIAKAIAGINAKYNQRVETVKKEVYALEEKKRNAENGLAKLEEKGKEFRQAVDRCEKADEYYTRLMGQLKIRKAASDGNEGYGSDHAFIIDAGFSLEMLVTAGFGKIYTTQEEMEHNPFLKEVADVQVKVNNLYPDLLKTRTEMDKRASSLMALICDKKEKRSGYTILLSREMMEYITPFLREKRIPMSVVY